MRKITFANNQYYHIYNRGVEKRDIFLDKSDYNRLLKSISDFNNACPAWKIRGEASNEMVESYVEIVAYCINPNHFHLILKQLRDNGISDFMHKLGTGYTMYFNKKNEHSGVIFQGVFNSVHVDSNEYLLYLSAYVNCNSEVHGIEKAESYQWCSFSEYTKSKTGITSGKEVILGQFASLKDYAKYAKIQAGEMQRKKEMAKFLLE